LDENDGWNLYEILGSMLMVQGSRFMKMLVCFMGKNIVKQATQVSGHFLNDIFVCLKDHKWSIIVWIVIMFLGIFFNNYKVYMLKAWHKSKMLLYVQSTQTLKVDNPCFP
jgi:hypothetical protein